MKTLLFLLTLLIFSLSYSQNLDEQIDNNYQKYRLTIDSNVDSALIYILKAKKLNEKLNDANWNARIYHGIGYSYFFKQQYSLSLENFNYAVLFAKETSNPNILSKSYNQIGLIYSLQNNFKRH